MRGDRVPNDGHDDIAVHAQCGWCWFGQWEWQAHLITFWQQSVLRSCGFASLSCFLCSQLLFGLAFFLVYDTPCHPPVVGHISS
jgi:hypothetical protein